MIPQYCIAHRVLCIRCVNVIMDLICKIVNMKQFTKHVKEVVNDPQLFMNKRAHSKNMVNFDVSIYDNRE